MLRGCRAGARVSRRRSSRGRSRRRGRVAGRRRGGGGRRRRRGAARRVRQQPFVGCRVPSPFAFPLALRGRRRRRCGGRGRRRARRVVLAKFHPPRAIAVLLNQHVIEGGGGGLGDRARVRVVDHLPQRSAVAGRADGDQRRRHRREVQAINAAIRFAGHVAHSRGNAFAGRHRRIDLRGPAADVAVAPRLPAAAAAVVVAIIHGGLRSCSPHAPREEAHRSAWGWGKDGAPHAEREGYYPRRPPRRRSRSGGCTSSWNVARPKVKACPSTS